MSDIKKSDGEADHDSGLGLGPSHNADGPEYVARLQKRAGVACAHEVSPLFALKNTLPALNFWGFRAILRRMKGNPDVLSREQRRFSGWVRCSKHLAHLPFQADGTIQ